MRLRHHATNGPYREAGCNSQTRKPNGSFHSYVRNCTIIGPIQLEGLGAEVSPKTIDALNPSGLLAVTVVSVLPVLVDFLGWLPLLRLLCAQRSLVSAAVLDRLVQLIQQIAAPVRQHTALPAGNVVKERFESVRQSLLPFRIQEDAPQQVVVRYLQGPLWKRRPEFMASHVWRLSGFDELANKLCNTGANPKHWTIVQQTEEGTPAWTEFYENKIFVFWLSYSGLEVTLPLRRNLSRFQVWTASADSAR